jgi:hypothetical protein
MTSLEERIYKTMGSFGRMLGSKGRYVYNNPTNVVIFNSNFVGAHLKNKVWYGDFDLTLEHRKLQELQKIVGDFYVLHEMDARFENERAPKFDDYVAFVTKSGIELNPSCKYKYVNGNPYYAREEKKDLATEPSAYEKKKLIEFKLPPMTKFEYTSKKDPSPLDKIQGYLIKKYGKELAQKIWSNLYFTKELDEKFESMIEKYFKKCYKLKGYDLEKNMNWVIFDTPINLANGGLNPQWAKAGKAYITKRAANAIEKSKGKS